MEIGDICDFYDAVSDVREINGYDISQYYEKHSSVLKLSAKKIETSISLNIPLDDQLHRISNGFDKYVDIVNKVEMRIQRAKEIVNSGYDLSEQELAEVVKAICLFDLSEAEIYEFKESIISFAINSGDSEGAELFASEYYGTYKKYFAYNAGNLQKTNFIMGADMLFGAAFYVLNNNSLESFDKDILFFGKTWTGKLDMQIFFLAQSFKWLGLETEQIILENCADL